MPEAQTDPETTTGTGGEAAAGAAEGGTSGEPKKITLTQDEMDRIIAERVARAKPKDYDELVALKARVDSEAEEKKTELQKEKEAREAAERAAKERTAAADRKLIRAEILTEATAQKATDPEIVIALLQGSEDIAVDENGTVTGAKEAVKQLLKSKPILVAGTTQSSGGAEFGGNDKQTVQERITQLESEGKFKEARELKMGLIQIGT